MINRLHFSEATLRNAVVPAIVGCDRITVRYTSEYGHLSVGFVPAASTFDWELAAPFFRDLASSRALVDHTESLTAALADLVYQRLNPVQVSVSAHRDYGPDGQITAEAQR